MFRPDSIRVMYDSAADQIVLVMGIYSRLVKQRAMRSVWEAIHPDVGSSVEESFRHIGYLVCTNDIQARVGQDFIESRLLDLGEL